MASPTHRRNALYTMSLCLLLAPATARAQAVEPQPQAPLEAQALYEQATAEMDAKSYASACVKLEEVTRLVPEGLGAKLTLGECYEALGKLASAWSQYTTVATMAEKAGQSDRAQKAAARAAALQPRLATMTIEVPDDVRSIPGLAVTRDGVPVGEAQWGAPLPVDAGGHEILATAPNRKARRNEVDVVADGAAVSVTVKAPALLARADAKPAPPQPITPPERAWQRPIALAAMGLGVTGFGVGAVLGGLAISRNSASNADNHCDAASRCDAEGFALRRDAIGLGNASTVAIVVGSALLAGGAVLFFTAPSSSTAPDRAGVRTGRWSATIAVMPGGIRVGGMWR